jgi:hypothetical protein
MLSDNILLLDNMLFNNITLFGYVSGRNQVAKRKLKKYILFTCLNFYVFLNFSLLHSKIGAGTELPESNKIFYP